MPLLKNWIHYTGNKSQTFKHIAPTLRAILQSLLKQEQVIIAEPCAGSAYLTIQSVAILKELKYGGRIVCHLNDINADVIRMLQLLITGKHAELYEDPTYEDYMCCYRAGTRDKSHTVANIRRYEANRSQYLQQFQQIAAIFAGVDVLYTTKPTGEFLESIQADLLIFDPPYIGRMILYRVNDYDIEKYVADVEYIKAHYPHYLIYNDIVSKYLHVHHDMKPQQYIVNTGGKFATSRVELLYVG